MKGKQKKMYGHPELYQDKPLCFQEEQTWERWQEAEIQAAKDGQPVDLDGYCELCTPSYQKRMRKENKCAYPNVHFIVFNRRQEEQWEPELSGMR
jgi:hypothetical protein